MATTTYSNATTMSLRRFVRGGYKDMTGDVLVVDSKGNTVFTASPGSKAWVATVSNEQPPWLKGSK